MGFGGNAYHFLMSIVICYKVVTIICCSHRVIYFSYKTLLSALTLITVVILGKKTHF